MTTASALSPEIAYQRITQILGCKWSLSIFDCLEKGISRPSAISREIEGLSTRVLHRCLNRLEQDGLLAKSVFDEIPPRAEYRLSDQGERFLLILRDARALASAWSGTQAPVDLSLE